MDPSPYLPLTNILPEKIFDADFCRRCKNVLNMEESRIIKIADEPMISVRSKPKRKTAELIDPLQLDEIDDHSFTPGELQNVSDYEYENKLDVIIPFENGDELKCKNVPCYLNLSNLVKEPENSEQITQTIADKNHSYNTEGSQGSECGDKGLALHRKIHAERKSGYRCTYCHRILKDKSSFLLHISKHIGVKPICCETCGEAFEGLRQCREHKRIHIKATEPVRCNICGKKFVRQTNLIQHKKIHPACFPCCECGQNFPSSESLNSHICEPTNMS